MFMIGEFSKIAQVATSQLRFYDRIQLFQPEHTDKFTGYRYYRATQLPDLHRILAMRDLGLSIEQIQDLIADGVTAEALRGMLALKKAQVQQELQEQAMRLHHIDARLRLVEEEDAFDQDEIVLKALPDRLFYGFRTTLADLRQVRPIAFELGKLLPNRVSKKKLNHMLVLQHADGFALDNADVEIGYLINSAVKDQLTLSEGYELTQRTLPEIETVACLIRLGGPEKSVACYSALGRWAEANGYQIGGPVHEKFIVPPRPGRLNEAVTEIQLPVILRDANPLQLN